MYLLDTNVISELRRNRPHGAVLAWLESVADEDLHLCAVTLGELQAGVEITREQDPDKAAEIEAWIDEVAHTWNVLPLNARTFRTWAKLMHRRSDDLLVDALIAATAIDHDLVVVTRNVRDFAALGIKTLNPFEESISPREQEVLQLIAEGISNGEIAERLSISERTVKGHVSSALAKLGAKSRIEAVRMARQRGFLSS